MPQYHLGGKSSMATTAQLRAAAKTGCPSSDFRLLTLAGYSRDCPLSLHQHNYHPFRLSYAAKKPSRSIRRAANFLKPYCNIMALYNACTDASKSSSYTPIKMFKSSPPCSISLTLISAIARALNVLANIPFTVPMP